ncbi:hypothetical protein [Atlantibacter hermannii]|uniref:hypothetical protein n=1 Tax=Atlantibacter hermannii TaxID=565 RepID=UPI00254EDB28|nr:hypothetical protein [Atlantibacter hermannii]
MEFSKDDSHPYDWLFISFSKPLVMLGLQIFILMAGVILTASLHNPSLLPKFGTLSTLPGILLTMAPMFYKGLYRAFEVYSPEFGDLPKGSDGKPSLTTVDSRKLSITIVIGVVMVSISTIISAFGDLLF